jgi:hypothetical protein
MRLARLAALAILTVILLTVPLAAQAQQAAKVQLGEVIFRDDFDNPAGGRLPRVSSHPDIDQGYVDGEYLFRLAPSYKESSRFVGPEAVFANTHVEVDGRLVGGTETRWLGVACRIVIKDGEPVGAYIFAVLPAAGWFSLTRLEPGRFVRLVPDQFSEVVRRVKQALFG